MKIESITLKNFKAFREAELRELPQMCVFVGANGAGKSTLFHVFGFLKDALTDDVHVALTRLGGSRGLQEVRSRHSTGPIEIELKFREKADSPLYPMLLMELAEEFRAYANRGGQVFISTHSPDFLNACQLEEVYWIVKDKGYSVVRRAADDQQVSAYMSQGDQMGYLWKQGFFQGINL